MSAVFRALAGVLDDLASVLDGLTDEEYVERAAAKVSGSIGSHVRHCLDHVLALERGIAGELIDYDARKRDRPVEQDRSSGLAALSDTARRIHRLDHSLLQRPVLVRTQLDSAGQVITVGSTIGRELAFVISHTIHHSATINVLLNSSGCRVPRRFGFAPSTPLDAVLACAP